MPEELFGVPGECELIDDRPKGTNVSTAFLRRAERHSQSIGMKEAVTGNYCTADADGPRTLIEDRIFVQL